MSALLIAVLALFAVSFVGALVVPAAIRWLARRDLTAQTLNNAALLPRRSVFVDVTGRRRRRFWMVANGAAVAGMAYVVIVGYAVASAPVSPRWDAFDSNHERPPLPAPRVTDEPEPDGRPAPPPAREADSMPVNVIGRGPAPRLTPTPSPTPAPSLSASPPAPSATVPSPSPTAPPSSSRGPNPSPPRPSPPRPSPLPTPSHAPHPSPLPTPSPSPSPSASPSPSPPGSDPDLLARTAGPASRPALLDGVVTVVRGGE